MRLSVLAIVAVCLSTSSAIAQESAIEAGETAFRKCLTCHKVGEDAPNSLGPVLNDVLGRQAGTYPGYNYSQAMIDAGRNGLVWTSETLSRFIASPRKALPGNHMTFAGVRNAEERANLLAYLRTLSSGYVPPDK